MNKDEKNELKKLVKELEAEANPHRPASLEDEKTNDFYNRINILPDVKSKIRLLRGVLKEIENVRLEKIKKEYPAKSLASGKQPIKVWKKHIRQSLEGYSLYKKIKRMIQDLRKKPQMHFPMEFKTYQGYLKFIEEVRKSNNIMIRNKIEKVFGFIFQKEKEHSTTIKDLNEKLLYWEYVKKEYIQNKKYCEDIDIKGDTPFIEKIQAEIDYLKKEIETIHETETQKHKSQSKKGRDNQTYKPVLWLTHNSDLLYWISKYRNEPVGFEHIKKVVRENFLNQKGKRFINYSKNYIQQGINNLLDNVKSKNKSKHGKIIDDIIELSDNEENMKIDTIISGFIERKFIAKHHKKNFIDLFQNIL